MLILELGNSPALGWFGSFYQNQLLTVWDTLFDAILRSRKDAHIRTSHRKIDMQGYLTYQKGLDTHEYPYGVGGRLTYCLLVFPPTSR